MIVKTVCIYHSRDLDGWMSAAIVKGWWLGKNKCRIIKDSFKKEGTLKELVGYFKTVGYNKARVSTLENALLRNNKIYKYKIEKI